jgi:hypothetical protein
MAVEQKSKIMAVLSKDALVCEGSLCFVWRECKILALEKYCHFAVSMVR